MIQYRLLSADELPSAVRLWTEVFGVEARFFQTLLDGGDPDDFSVGAFDGDRMVSSVHVFMRWFRDREGRPQKVGGIGSVSTHPEHRKFGHSSALLSLAIEEMASRGCIWSYLGTGVNHHYARLGWRSVSTPYFRGAPLADCGMSSMKGSPVEKESYFDLMPAVYDAFSRDRPMANDRSTAMWEHAVRYRVSRSEDDTSVMYNGSGLGAYLVSRRGASSLELVEGACLPSCVDSLEILVRQCIALAADSGVSSVTSYLPEVSPGHLEFVSCCSQVLPVEDCAWMVRPIADRISLPNLVAIHADPRGRRSDLDNF